MAHVFRRPDRLSLLPQDQINAANFSKLEVAWHFKTDQLGARTEYKLEGTPLEINGTVYTTAGSRRDVVALDATPGELKWVYSLNEGARGELAPPAFGPWRVLLDRWQRAMSAFFTSPQATGWSN